MQDPRKAICNLGWFPKKPKAEQTVPSESSGSVSQRLIEAEDILSDLSTGFWVSTLDDADAPVNVKMGQRVLNYWKKQNASNQAE